MAGKDTPSMRQYHAAKGAHPDAILFFRMGDFYEMFFEDAVLVSKLLDLALTSRNKGAFDEVPMAGVPYHAAHGYIAKLLQHGQKVAICEQMADPSKVRGIVPREVVRVITPGLVTDADQLDPGANHFLGAVEAREGSFGLALLDLSTAELRATRVSKAPDLLAELLRASPRELILGPLEPSLVEAIRTTLRGVVMRDDLPLDAATAPAELARIIGNEATRDAISQLDPAALAAAARVLRMAQKCSPGMRLPVDRVEPFSSDETLALDEVAQRHLELVTATDGGKSGSLLELLNATSTAPGARLLRRRLLSPLVDVASIRRRHDAVELFVMHPAVRSELRQSLSTMGDIERLAVRTSLREVSPKELGTLRDALAAAPHVLAALDHLPPSEATEVLRLDVDPIDPLPDLCATLQAALVDRPPSLAREPDIFRVGHDKELDEARELQTHGTQKLSELEARLKSETGATTLKVKFTRVFGWYIEVTGRHLDKVPPAWRRKQTVAGGERYTNDELDTLSDKILHAEERAKEREQSLYKQLVEATSKHVNRLHRLASRLAELDVHASLAEIAHRFDFRRPEIDATLELEIEDGRHPVVERLAAAGQFVPNDTKLDADHERLWIITGPNMAGKSTFMRQVALIVLLAQMGSFVPASRARIGVVDRILSRVGASDNLSRGESTFMVEMRESALILKNATRRSLVILDEIGRGTSTYDGLAIAWSVAEHLHTVTRCRTLFATHYHELTELVNISPNAANYSVSARELGDDVVFLHKIVQGAASRSYGIAVARLAGLPESVLARARAILQSLELGGALPSGAHATLRGRDRSGAAQLDLFGQPVQAAASNAPNPVLETLRAVDPDRLTPLEALQLVAKLREMLK
jgi:DNA mismatch repair protein MutS